MTDPNAEAVKELKTISRKLGNASAGVQEGAAKVLDANSLKLKNIMILDMQRNLRSRKSTLKHLKRAVTYDRVKGAPAGSIQYETGIDRRRPRSQGRMGGIVYFGTSKTKAVLNIDYPMKVVEPGYARDIDALLGKIARDL